MNVLLVVVAGGAILLLASRTYPFWIGRVFDQNDANPPPSERFADGKEYVKTPSQVVFAHHFASIAGAGPIVGPILALAFGWGPAWLWIIFGGILYGAVHDMTAMFVSLREGGKTIAEVARRTLGTTGYLLFVLFLILVLCLINAIFLNLSARALTSVVSIESLGVPARETVLATFTTDGVVFARIGGIATTSVFIMTAFAPVLGVLIYRRGLRALPAFGFAAAVCVGSVRRDQRVPQPCGQRHHSETDPARKRLSSRGLQRHAPGELSRVARPRGRRQPVDAGRLHADRQPTRWRWKRGPGIFPGLRRGLFPSRHPSRYRVGARYSDR